MEFAIEFNNKKKKNTDTSRKLLLVERACKALNKF